jgi:TolB protein
MRFSKDGARVAYLADRDGTQDLYVAFADGRNVVRLTNDAGLESWPSWAPDGRVIYFSMRPATSRVATIDVSHLDLATERRPGRSSP